MKAAAGVVALIVLAAASPLFSSGARADTPPRLDMTVEAGVGNDFVFAPAKILLPSIPIVLNLTVVHNGSSGQGFHTFSIRDSAASIRISVRVNTTGDTAHVEFTVATATQITYKGATFTAEQSAGAIKFFCEPHEPIGMVGTIALGGAPTGGPAQNLGVPIQAYWIGLIGLGAMLIWIGVAYFLVKTSSRHFRDHRDHLRRGLP